MQSSRRLLVLADSDAVLSIDDLVDLRVSASIFVTLPVSQQIGDARESLVAAAALEALDAGVESWKERK